MSTVLAPAVGSKPASSASWVTVVAAAPTMGKTAPTMSAYGTSATSAAIGIPTALRR